METINDRIEQLVNELFNGNKAAFAKSIGLPPTGMSNYLGSKRRSKPSVDMVTKIITNLHVNPLWLLIGEGSMQLPETSAEMPPESDHDELVRLRAENEVLREVVGLKKNNGMKADVG